MSHIRKLLPVLSSKMRKGTCGRLAIIGGSEEYTGAPYFAAISALKLGADLVHVFCVPEAAAVIKGYSPDLIVHPRIETQTVIDNLGRCDAIVLGPGLGRMPARKDLVEQVLLYAKQKDIPTVVDADALWFVNDLLSTCSSISNVVLTPNKVEFSRLCEAALGRKDVLQIEDFSALCLVVAECSQAIGTSIFLKGSNDVICNPNGTYNIGDEPGSLRRCGGQGDTVCGTLGLFLLWASRKDGDWAVAKTEASLASSQLVRWAARRAFEGEGRAMTSSDLIAQIEPILKEIDNEHTN